MKLFQDKYPIHDNAEYVVDYVYNNPTGETFIFSLSAFQTMPFFAHTATKRML